MVDRLRKILGTTFSGLHEAALVIGLSAVASQLLALLRDRVFASQFGVGAVLDIYYASFRIPDIIFTAVASLVLMTVLVPYLTRELGKGDEQARELLDSVFTVFSVIVFVVSLFALIFMPELARLVAPGFSVDASRELVSLSRLLLLSPILLGFSGILSTAVHVKRIFFVYALSPILYNLGIIAGAIFLYPAMGLSGLGLGVLLGAFMHVLVQLGSVKKARLLPRLTRRINWAMVLEVFSTSIPRTFTLGVHQLVIIFFTSLASLWTVGSIVIFNFAFNLQSVPLAIIGASYSMAAFPFLSSLHYKGDRGEFAKYAEVAARHIIFWSLPVAALFIVLRAQIVRTILGGGFFDWNSTRLTAAALALFALSVPAQSLVHFFVRGFYASGRTLLPLVVNTTSSVGMILLTFFLQGSFFAGNEFRYFFESLLRVGDTAGTEILLLPLAYSICIILNAMVYVAVFFIEYGSFVSFRSFVRSGVHFMGCAVIAGGVAYIGLDLFDGLFSLNTLPGVFLQGLSAGLMGIAGGLVLLVATRNPEFAVLISTLRRRFWKEKTIVPPPEEPRTV